MHETEARIRNLVRDFRQHAIDIVPDIENLDTDGMTDDLGELEALTWMEAARQVAVASNITDWRTNYRRKEG